MNTENERGNKNEKKNETHNQRTVQKGTADYHLFIVSGWLDDFSN